MMIDEKNGPDARGHWVDIWPCILNLPGNWSEGKGKSVADKICAVNAFKAKMNMFSVHLQKKTAALSLHTVLHGNASASGAFDKAVEKYSQVM